MLDNAMVVRARGFKGSATCLRRSGQRCGCDEKNERFFCGNARAVLAGMVARGRIARAAIARLRRSECGK